MRSSKTRRGREEKGRGEGAWEGKGVGGKGRRRGRGGKRRILSNSANSVSSSAHNSIHLIMLFHVLFETVEDTDLIRENNQE